MPNIVGCTIQHGPKLSPCSGLLPIRFPQPALPPKRRRLPRQLNKCTLTPPADSSGAAAAAMLPSLIGSYLTAACPPPLLPPAAAAGAPSPSARSRSCLRAVPRLVSRRCSRPAEAVRAANAEEEDEEVESEALDEGFPSWEGGNGGEEEDYDHDPEIGDIMGDYFDDPNKAQTRMEERIRKKRHKIVQAKTGSPNPMKVVFNK